ncbi:NCS2 family permease [bacterium]|nr:NCS2 family permease [bacterium]
MLSRWFGLDDLGTTVRTEVLAGTTTFLTMAYIIVVQPLVLSGQMFGFSTGMDFGSVMTATCLAAALATLIMGLYAKYPIAQAPGMGENFFFVFTALPVIAAAGHTNAWSVALGVVFISGVLFFLLSLTGVREAILHSVSPSMKNAMAVGIGLFIAFIGLQNAGLIVSSAAIVPGANGPILSTGTLVKLNHHFASVDLVLFFMGLILTAVLHVRKVRASILLGILGTTVLALLFKGVIALWPAGTETVFFKDSMLLTRFSVASKILAAPPSLAPTFFKMNIKAALTLSMFPLIIIFLFMDLFDTLGTLVGVSEQAGFMKDNRLPRARKAMISDAVGTVVGAGLGTSTVTSFIESAAGVEQGGRSGLTAVVAAGGFLLALFFSPMVNMLGSYPVITAPALVIVGAMMMRNVIKIDWKDYSESIPAFLMILGMPLAYSVADGLALGFIVYPLIKLLSGRGREVSWLMTGLSVVLIMYFIFLRAPLG